MKYYYIIVLSIFLNACTKDPVVEDPGLEVSVKESTIRAGVPITFNINSNADIVSFYSGETGGDYTFSKGRILDLEDMTLSITTNVSGSGTQMNQLAILVSTDFNGKYTIADIKAATWTPITNRFNLSTNANTVVSSAIITDLVNSDKPVYLAYCYIREPESVKGGARTWNISASTLKSNTSIGLIDVGTHPSLGFQLVHEGIFEAGRSSVSSTNVVLRGNLVDRETRTETWAVSRGINSRILDLGPDKPIALSGSLDQKPNEFTFTYAKPGNYKAVFIGSNTTVYGSKSVAKVLDLVVQ